MVTKIPIIGKIGKIIKSDVIYSQESPKMEEFFRDFDWDLNRFVEYRSPFTRKETLPIKKPLKLFRIGTEIVFDLK